MASATHMATAYARSPCLASAGRRWSANRLAARTADQAVEGQADRQVNEKSLKAVAMEPWILRRPHNRDLAQDSQFGSFQPAHTPRSMRLPAVGREH